MIGPAVFALTEGAQMVRAKTLAFQIISRLRDDDDDKSSSSRDEPYVDKAGNQEGTLTTASAPSPPSNLVTTDRILHRGPRSEGDDSDDQDRDHNLLDDIVLQRPRGGSGSTPATNGNPSNDSVTGEPTGDSSSNDETPTDDDHIEHLLTWLWACEKKMVASPKLFDPIHDDQLIARLRSIRAKLNENEGPGHRAANDPLQTLATETTRDAAGLSSPIDQNNIRETATAGLSSLAMTTKEIAEVLERMETNRRQEHKKKENDNSFLRNIGTMQQELFSSLCTDELGEIATHPIFLKSLMDTKTPQKAIAMIRSEIWEWEGSFFDGPFHRFLANGYLSREGNKGSPGGFTLFMFCPKM